MSGISITSLTDFLHKITLRRSNIIMSLDFKNPGRIIHAGVILMGG